MRPWLEDPDFPLSDILAPRLLSPAERDFEAFIAGIRVQSQRHIILCMPDLGLLHRMPPPSTYLKSTKQRPAAVLDWLYWKSKPKLHRELAFTPFAATEEQHLIHEKPLLCVACMKPTNLLIDGTSYCATCAGKR